MPAALRLAAAIFLFCISTICCLEDGTVPDFSNASPAALPYFTQVFYDRFSNFSESFAVEISQHLGFCIKDPKKDWNGAFNFSSDLEFVSDCITDTDGDLTQRLCTAAEIKLYFNSFFIDGGNNDFLRPNKNCNTTSWVSGCEPGWACSVVEGQNVHIKDSANIPSRTQNCRPCCEGFFCPRGITCMIPCPLGAYCPRAELNTSTGVCDPYNYQLPPGQTNHSCGGADRWADAGSNSEIFCPAGFFCPSTVRRVFCSSGYYCRMGSISEKRCFRKNSCKPNSANQNITLFGALLMVCRLSADMPKADKVLVVERVIESLGLQAVRDCLVGTVEKRGISGGQRKRVNVGLEMVMEPSLLILDEPTSGLDSASSQLLLRALRREALEGVNICMVVHQPSYTLFKMFDDLVLLAKGGLVVYLGAVKKVEDYFAGLGIDVPERVNPPDYFIDILEGIIKPPGINVRQLPLKWMLLNGNYVPPDMQQNLSTVDILEKDCEANDSSGSGDQSAPGEVWDNMADEFQHRGEHLEHKLSKVKDLSNRRTPGILQQYRYFLGRVGKQRLREARIQGIDFLILGLAGVCLGTLAKVNDESFGAAGYTYTIIAVSLLCKIGALRSFSPEKLHYWRERSSGMSSLAYFLSKDTIDHFNTLVKPIVYLSMFYFFNNPRSSILDNYVILVALVYCVTGIGYVFAICFNPGSAQLWSALLPVVLTLIATQQRNSKLLSNLCYSKWALEGFVIASAERYSGVWLITRCGSLMKFGYNIHNWYLCVIVLFAYGLVSRFIAFVCMVTVLKK
ncbi:Putative white-brown complex like protein 30 [Dendrobium catenatum]|uniref:White-brown complex like protein 30 n=1 Tax=Dendrobium catenatum TaxID=906689 RepID=A0A2I0WPN5_9ASPA|nr:Putative white-brown complex like protein 30 [Dendrobium catenatum]